MIGASLEAVFAGAEDRPVLIGYLPAGYPDPDAFLDATCRAAAVGLDVLELGIPVDGATLDGAVIQDALRRQAAQDIDVDRALKLGGRARAAANVPVLAMAYVSTLRGYGGVETFLERCREVGLDGILVPDLPKGLFVSFCRVARGLGLAPALFVGDPTDEAVTSEIKKAEPSFVYMRSLDGTTGEVMDVAVAQKNLRRLRLALEPYPLPVVVGFGVKGGMEAAALSRAGADGIAVGTSLVEAASTSSEAVRSLVLSLSGASRTNGEEVP